MLNCGQMTPTYKLTEGQQMKVSRALQKVSKAVSMLTYIKYNAVLDDGIFEDLAITILDLESVEKLLGDIFMANSPNKEATK